MKQPKRKQIRLKPRIQFKPELSCLWSSSVPIQHQLDNVALALQRFYPDKSLQQIQQALAIWLNAAISELATSAVWHCHSGPTHVAIQRDAFQRALYQERVTLDSDDDFRE